MEKIEFSNVMPAVFAQRADLRSDVWGQRLTFERGGLYLVEAASGQGKSTFCSYVIGYRHDYTGQLLFDGRDASTLRVADWVQLRQRSVSHLFQELRVYIIMCMVHLRGLCPGGWRAFRPCVPSGQGGEISFALVEGKKRERNYP